MGLVTVRNLVLNRHLVMALHGSIISIARGRSVQSGQRWKSKPEAKSVDCVENRQYHPTLGVQTFKKKETDASTGKSRIRIRLRLFSEPVQLF